MNVLDPDVLSNIEVSGDRFARIGVDGVAEAQDRALRQRQAKQARQILAEPVRGGVRREHRFLQDEFVKARVGAVSVPYRVSLHADYRGLPLASRRMGEYRLATRGETSFALGFGRARVVAKISSGAERERECARADAQARRGRPYGEPAPDDKCGLHVRHSSLR